ncbi:MAG TPA: patatin-like phospholipase family protein [Pyrinomonadaceae bacterium]|nr:patatin-like phospholipase family protein [Pyrinomonadaceae bacterium]
MSDHPLRVYEVLEEEYDLLHGVPSPSVDSKKPAEERLKNIIKENHKKNHAAICLSGGGIRSATFGLGVLQGLAHNNLLDKFNYVSTVSGGGYIGSWLSAWIHREEKGLPGVAKQLPGEHPPYVMKPEAEPITHLRAYSNYLTPKLGMLSADTWTLVAIWIRNLLLNWLVLIPLLLAVLALPRLFVSLSQLSPPGYVRVGALLLAIILGVQMIVYVAISRPTIAKKDRDQKSFLKWCFVPMLLSATLLALYWAWFNNANTDLERSLTLHILDGRSRILGFIAFGVGLHLAAWVVYTILMIRSPKLIVSEFVGLLFNGIVGGLMLFVVSLLFPEPAKEINRLLLYSTLAVPVYLLLVFLALSLFVGIASRWTKDEDREWWARYGAWVLIALVVWIIGSFLVVMGPSVITDVWAKRVVPAGGVIGVITALLARSAKLPAKGEKSQGWMGLVMQHALPLGAIVFAAVLVMSLSIATDGLIDRLAPFWNWTGLLSAKAMGHSSFDAFRLDVPRTREILLFMGVAGGLGLLMAHVINTNKFSYHAMYRNRLIRAYLGASRQSVERRPNKFTGFDSDDNVNMCELRPEMLHTKSFKEPNGFSSLVKKLQTKSGPVSAHIVANVLSDSTKQLLNRYDPELAGDQTGKLLESALIRDLNNALLQFPIIPSAIQSEFGIDLEGMDPAPTSVKFVKRNRQALETAFKDDIRPANSYQNIDLEDLSPTSAEFVKRNSEAFEAAFEEILPAIVSDVDINWEDLSPTSAEFVTRHRQAFEAALEEIRPAIVSYRRPLHIVNITLNLVGGDRLAWQQRKAESFTVSPLHCGSFQIHTDGRTGPAYGSYRRTFDYGGQKDGGISLGTAMAISGAAASPNMGYYSSPVVTFLMTLFNVRLGWWLGNPAPAGEVPLKLRARGIKHYFELAHPKSAVYPIIAEALGWTDDKNNYVYLTDGGHFENLGLYEMVLRRCRLIVISDAAGDPDFQYNDLGNAVQKVRTDLGIPIDFGPMNLFPRSEKKPGVYCAIGTIRYSCIDKGEPDGKIIYLKPAFYGDEPRDIYRYAMTHETFPQQSTGDQWFDESQFESYRKLGSYIVDKICNAGAGEGSSALIDAELDGLLKKATAGSQLKVSEAPAHQQNLPDSGLGILIG